MCSVTGMLCAREKRKGDSSGRLHNPQKQHFREATLMLRMAAEAETMIAFTHSMHFALQEQAVLASTLFKIHMSVANLQT